MNYESHIQFPAIFRNPRKLLPNIPLPNIKYIIVSSVESLGTIHPNIYATLFITVFVTIFVYIKIKYPFWNGEPVYHTYDFWRRWYSSPYILHKIPLKTKYHQRQNVITLKTEIITIPQWKCIADFLQYFSIPSERILNTMTHTQYMSLYNAGHTHPSFLSVILPITEKEFGENTTILAIITSKSSLLYFKHNPTPTPCYYLDTIVTHRNRSNYIRTLFDTHVYHQRKIEPDVSVAVWKQEGSLVSGVVPLVHFSVGTYYLGNILGRLIPIISDYQIIQIQNNNASVLNDCWKHDGFVNQFDCVLQIAVSSILAGIKSGVMRVFVLQRGEHVYALYYFKIPQLIYEEMDDGKGNGGETIQFVGSVCNCHDNLPLFYAGFLQCLGAMVKQHKSYQMLLIEWIGHNLYLTNHWEKDYPIPICQQPAGYYIYNMIVPSSPLMSRNCFIFV